MENLQLEKQIKSLVNTVREQNNIDYMILDSCCGYSTFVIDSALKQGLVVCDANGFFHVNQSNAVNVKEESAIAPKETTSQAHNVIETILEPIKLREEKVVITSEGKLALRRVYTGNETQVKTELRILSIGCNRINRIVKARKHGNNGCWLLVIYDHNCINCNRNAITESKFCSEHCEKCYIAFNY